MLALKYLKIQNLKEVQILLSVAHVFVYLF